MIVSLENVAEYVMRGYVMIVSLENVPEYVMRGYVMIVSLQNFPTNIENLLKNLKPENANI